MSVHLNHSWPANRGGRISQEAVMGQAIPRQHPAVVLRSHYRQLKTLLAIMLVAIVGLGLAVAILATDDESSTGTATVQPIEYGDFSPATGQPLAGRAAAANWQGVSTPAQSIRPDESAVAAAITPKPEVVRPDESAVAAAIATQPEVARPDESKVAAAISRTQQGQSADGQHDESDVAAAISGN
jgi:hypothetical protein